MAKILAGKSASKKDFITKKACGLFRQNGYTNTSMRNIADAIGVEAPSLYNYIGSKTELLQSICSKVGNEFVQYISIAEADNENPIVKLERVIRFHINCMIENFDAVYVANHDWKHLPENALQQYLNLRSVYEKKFEQIISDGIKAGTFKTSSSYITMLTILSAVRIVEYWHRHKKGILQKQVEDNLVQHLLNGILN
jgi:TetR/AcrR family transcriptional regulator, cholesterol catabolism regulator